jgi:hypothetical protein
LFVFLRVIDWDGHFVKLDAKPEDDIQLSMFVRSVLRAEALSADFIWSLWL